jgi:hypothetical protein
VIGGGDPHGNGLDIEYCLNCNFNIQSILSSGINYAQGRGTTNLTLQLPAGATSGWSTKLDAAAVVNYAALGVSTGGLGAAVPFVMPISPPALPINPTNNPMGGTWTTPVNTESGTYFQIGPLTCVDLVAQLKITDIGSASGAITFYLPVRPLITSHDAIAVSEITNGGIYSTGIIWPPLMTGTQTVTPATQILFVPILNRNYGEIQFQSSKYNSPSQPTVLGVPVSVSGTFVAQGLQLNTLYTFAINGCYQ